MEVSIGRAADIIARGGVVAFPTETVYGLGARADSASAVDKVYAIKERPKDNPMICHFADFEAVYEHVSFVPEYLDLLVQKFVPGPISFRLKIKPNSSLLPSCAGQDSVVVRIPSHPMARELIRLAGHPIVGPSANTSGKVSNTSARMVALDLGSKIDGVLDGGASQVGLESTIIDCTGDSAIRILRPGFIGIEVLMEALGEEFGHVSIIDFEHGAILDTVPGLKYKHYAPDTKLQKIASLQGNGILAGFTEDLEDMNPELESKLVFSAVFSFGSIQNQQEIARNMYSNIKRFDELNPGLENPGYFYIRPETEEKMNRTSLGRAIMNRINRACAAG